MRRVLAGALALALVHVPVGAADEKIDPKLAAAVEAVKQLKPQHGKIVVPGANATLDLGEAYDFYSAQDALTILTTVWGNPPEAATGVLGLVMKAGTSPLSDAWGAVVTYEDSGYVSDSDAASVDYNEILAQMREGEADSNAQRKAAGYSEMRLVGWAEQPNYDKAAHSVVWARDLDISDSDTDSLNYDVRTLGRRGVLSLNLVSSMPQLAEVKTAARDFASHASFDAGSRYADFDPSADKKAEYGIGGLIAAGVGVAVAKKLGLLAILLKFLKPILLAVVVGFAALRKRVAGWFGRGGDPADPA